MTTPTDARLDEPGDDGGLVAAGLIDSEAIDLA
jgi:hypothetical protein